MACRSASAGMSALGLHAAKDFAADWDAWHKQHEDRFAAADGSGVTVRLAPGEALDLDGARITGLHHFGPIPERGGLFPRDAAGVYEVAKRGGNDILRPRHPDTPVRTGFRGTPAYAPDPRWVIQGHYRPFDEPQDVSVGSV